MNGNCQQCGKFTPNKFCSTRCKWTWHNRNRTLTPNVDYQCKMCGKRVQKWVAPSRIASGVVTNEYCSRTCAGVGRAGPQHFNWKGGVRHDKDGYRLVYAPHHPGSSRGQYMLEHRLVMERHLGRRLKRKEVVHHINGNITDNRIENLRLYAHNGEHKRNDLKGVERECGRFKRGVKHTGG